MRVLTVVSEAPPVTSGVARSVGEIAEGLERRGHEVAIVSSADAAGLRWDRLRLSAVGAQLRSLVREASAFDVINVHGPSPTISDVALAQLLLRRPLAPVVYTHHFSLHFGVAGVDRVAAAYEWMMRRLTARCAAVVTTTACYGAMFEPVQPNVAVIPWGVDHERFRSGTYRYDGTRPLRIIAVGQFRRYKGMAVAVRAIAGQPELHLSLVGGGPLVDSVLSNVPRGATNVDYLGRVDDSKLNDVFQDHDVVLLPSRTKLEAFGIVLLEGMASGCVPVASDLPGVREVVGDAGVTARPRCPDSLRRELLSLARAPHEVERRKALALEAARRYTWSNTVEAYEELFRSILERRQGTLGC